MVKLIRAFATPRRLFVAGLALLIVALLSQLWVLHVLRMTFAVMMSHPAYRPKIPEESTILICMALVAIPGLAMALTGFFLGLSQIRRAAERAGLKGYVHGFNWTVGSFFIPIFNFYRPWVGLGELRRSVFVALKTGEGGKRWNKFGDLSEATIGFAVAVFAVAGVQIAYNFIAPSVWTPPSGPAGILTQVDVIRSRVLLNMAFLAMQIGLFFLYLETLQGPSHRLTALSAQGALSQV